MATDNKCTGLKVLDPVQGLVDYIKDIKPYHTKIMEVLVEYVHGEALDVTITDKMHTDIELIRPESTPLEYHCPRGYSLMPYGNPQGGWPILPANLALTDFEYDQYPAFNPATRTVTVPGDRSMDLNPGTRIEIVSWIEDYTDPQNIIQLPDPSGNFNKMFTVASAIYNAGTIDQWSGWPDPATYRLGDEPHTLITVQESFGAVPALAANQVYVAMMRLAPVEIEDVVSYSNVIASTPDEGYFRGDIISVVLSTLDGFGVAIPDTGKVTISGSVADSNVFVGDDLRILDSTGNNGLYNISSITYDSLNDETTFGVVERIRDITVDGYIRIDIPANMFIIDGNYLRRFNQGVMFNIAGGSFSGQYTTLYADFVNGKTRVRVTNDIITDGTVGMDMGVLKEVTYGFGESSDLCATTPHTMVRVKFHEHLMLSGMGLDLADDLIVYNMENNDAWGYELPLATNLSSMEPVIVEQPTAPVIGNLNDFWFNTTSGVLHRYTGYTWSPVQTVYWLDTDTKLLYYRTKNSFIDTNWVLYMAEPPGFAGTQPAIGAVEIIGQETFVADVTSGSPQPVYEFATLQYPIMDIVDNVSTEDYFVVAEDIRLDAMIDYSVGSRTLEVTGGGANDGTYHISRVIYMSDTDTTRVFVEENIPSVTVAGDITIGPLSVPLAGSPALPDTSLIRVTVDGVPAGITMISPYQFTVDSPAYDIEATILAKVFDRTHMETHARVATWSDAPHAVFHDGADILFYDDSADYAFITDPVSATEDYLLVTDPVTGAQDYGPLVESRAYVLPGGNYVHRMIPQNRLEIYNFTNNGGLLDVQQPAAFDVLNVDPITHEITIEGLHSWLFAPDTVMSVSMSDGTIEDLTVLASTELLTTTVIEVVEDMIGLSSRIADHHFVNTREWPVYEIDNVSDSIVVDGDYRLAFPPGSFVKVFDSTTGNNKVWTVAGGSPPNPSYDAVNGRTIIGVEEDIPDQDPYTTTTAVVVPANLPIHEAVLGAVYDPIVDVSDSDDQVKTIVATETPPHPDVEGIGYTWHGPVRFEIAAAYRTDVNMSAEDRLTMVNEFVYEDPTAGHPDDQALDAAIVDTLDFGWGQTQRWAIKSTNAASNEVIIDGDITGALDINDDAIIVGSQGNDDNYEIVSFVYAPGPNETTIVVRNPDLPVDPPIDLMGYFQLEDVDITAWFQYLIKEANSTTDTFTVHGNATADVQNGAQFRVLGTSNDGLYTIIAPPTYDSSSNTTDIVVTSILVDENGGWIESYRDYGIRLIFEDSIGMNIIENTDAALVLTAGSFIDAYDYNYYDVGALDENIATVLHLYGNSF